MPRPQTDPPKTFAGRVGAEIRRRREAKKLTVEEAAARAGVPAASWYHFEKGRLLLERLPAIAKGLGCKVRQIIPE
jgi:transcriptional regulator with XRE-family HTH domain